MKSLQEGFENVFDSSLVDYSSDFEKSDEYIYKKELIEKWMDENTINPNDHKSSCVYHLDNDLNIYVDGGVYIRKRKTFNTAKEFLPENKVGDFPDYINFKLCKGYFDCQAQGMTTLRGCPERVEGIGASFWCRHNNLKNLIGGPKYVESEYDCRFNPLESLEGIPEICPYYTLKDHFKVPENMEDELVKRVALPNWIDIYKLFLKRGQYDMIKEYGWDKAYWTKNISVDMNENFENVFDSSLIDYHEDFENQDNEYLKKQRIIDWLQDYVSIYDRDSGEQLAILDGEGIRLLKMIDANTKEESYMIDVLGDLEFDDCGIDKLPDYVIFHEIKGYFNANCVTFNTLKNFPSIINGDFRICDSAIKSFLNGPEVVGEDLYCTNNPQLKGIKAIQGLPKVNGEIHCDKNLEKYIYSLDDSGWE